MMEIAKFTIKEDQSIKSALQQIDRGAKKTVFVTDEQDRLVGALTDGDIRRWILKSGSLKENITKVYNRHPLKVPTDYTLDQVKSQMLEKSVEAIPVVDQNNKIVEILFWESIFQTEPKKPFRQLNVPVVIMAGGAGTRLDPFTKILPKPLIPIGEKPIIEIIIDEFRKYGIKTYYITLRYKAKMIKAFFEEYSSDIRIKYITEDSPLGTAGSLRYLQHSTKKSFFVSNCDIIIDTDYSNIYEFHLEHDFDLTLVATMVHHEIPYGVCDIGPGGKLKGINEKPEYDFLANAGFYVINPRILHFIPDHEFFNITDLIHLLLNNDKRIGVYPISEKSWVDVGQWQEYKNALRKINL